MTTFHPPQGNEAHAPGWDASPVEKLGALGDAAVALTKISWSQHSGTAVEEYLQALEQSSRQTAYVKAQLIAIAEADGIWALEGSSTITGWVKNTTGATKTAAARDVRLARGIRDHLPGTGAALARGHISAEHAHILVRETTKTAQLRDELKKTETGEKLLLDIAPTVDAGEFRKAVKHWATMADPRAEERAWREEAEKEAVFLAPTLGGYHLNGWLDPASGKALEVALNAQMGRKAKDDPRSPSQRRATALVTMAKSLLDFGQLTPHARIRPHISVHVPFTTLQALCNATGSSVPPRPQLMPGITAFDTQRALGGPRHTGQPQRKPHGIDRLPLSSGSTLEDPGVSAGEWLEAWKPGDDHVIATSLDHRLLTGHAPATLDDGIPIPPSVLARLCCDSRLMRIVFGPDGTVLDAGREERIFPAHQARAVIARDRHCRYPGCDAPPGYGEIHHSLHWAKHNGKTSVEHGILLCWYHHAYVHERNVTIASIRGAWVFSSEHGEVVTAPRHWPARAPFDRSSGAQEPDGTAPAEPSPTPPNTGPDPDDDSPLSGLG